MPDGVEGIATGSVCPYNIYASQPEIFQRRDAVMDTIDRVFRLVNESHCGVLSESDLDPLTLTELLTARGELDRQQAEKQNREYEKAKMEAEANRSPGKNIDFDAIERAKQGVNG